jgi:hypothetical protein
MTVTDTEPVDPLEPVEDVLEQRLEVDAPPSTDLPAELPYDADPADAIEQHLEVEDLDEEEPGHG